MKWIWFANIPVSIDNTYRVEKKYLKFEIETDTWISPYLKSHALQLKKEYIFKHISKYSYSVKHKIKQTFNNEKIDIYTEK